MEARLPSPSEAGRPVESPKEAFEQLAAEYLVLVVASDASVFLARNPSSITATSNYVSY